MATYTSTACQTNNGGGFFLNAPKFIENGVIARSVNFTFTTSASSGDVVQMVPVPKGAVVLDVTFAVTGGHGATSNLAFTVGDGNSTTRYSTSQSGAAAVGGGFFWRMNNAAGLGYSYSAEDTIDLIPGTIGSMSAQMTVRLTVTYAMDQATDGGS